jgi:hypothetical protein
MLRNHIMIDAYYRCAVGKRSLTGAMGWAPRQGGRLSFQWKAAACSKVIALGPRRRKYSLTYLCHNE